LSNKGSKNVHWGICSHLYKVLNNPLGDVKKFNLNPPTDLRMVMLSAVSSQHSTSKQCYN